MRSRSRNTPLFRILSLSHHQSHGKVAWNWLWENIERMLKAERVRAIFCFGVMMVVTHAELPCSKLVSCWVRAQLSIQHSGKWNISEGTYIKDLQESKRLLNRCPNTWSKLAVYLFEPLKCLLLALLCRPVRRSGASQSSLAYTFVGWGTY